MNENSGGDSPTTALPRYRSTKTVQALKLGAVDYDGNMLYPADPSFSAFAPPPDWWLRNKPVPGGYYVVYEDGYASFSPAKAFEEGNVLAEEWGIKPHQEPKYRIDKNGRISNRLTGEPIPHNEPVMIFRAKDALALVALSAYRAACDDAQGVPDSHIAAVAQRIRDFSEFARRNPARMKLPDDPLAITHADGQVTTGNSEEQANG